MPRGYRYVILAACGVALGVLSPPSNAARSDQSNTQSTTSRDLERIATALERPPERDAPDAGCDQGKENRKSDLCAQWKAADAAKDSADWTRRTFWLAVAGTIIGGLTLGAAAYAAFYAKAAADAASETLKHEVAMSGLQLNAILHIESVDFTDWDDGVPPQVSFSVRNVGTQPARSLTIVGAWGDRYDLDAEPLNLQPCKAPKGISPNGVFRVTLPRSAPEESSPHAPVYCQFELTWEFRAEEVRRIREFHQFDGKQFSFMRDY
jgi:hypothetical protein